MAQMVFDLIDPAELISFVRQFDNEVLRDEGRIVLDQYLPNQTMDNLEYRVRKGSLLDVDAAEFRNWDTPAPMMGRQGTSRMSGSLAPIARQIPLGEEEFHQVRVLLTQNNNPLIDQIFQDATLVTRAVQIRAELARGDVIDDAIVTISENGLVQVADFQRDASMFVTAGTVWTNPAAPMLSGRRRPGSTARRSTRSSVRRGSLRFGSTTDSSV
jgi:hypothetical protein